MPAGTTSRSSTLLATALPELVYERVTVIGPALGEGPLLLDSALVTLMTELATVVVSVLVVVVIGALLFFAGWKLFPKRAKQPAKV